MGRGREFQARIVAQGERKKRFPMRIRMPSLASLALILLVVAASSRAQQPTGVALSDTSHHVAVQSQAVPATLIAGPLVAGSDGGAPPPQTTHRFWDRENDLLFAGVGAGRALDYASTLNLRHRGIDEIFLTNSIVDNHALFAGIEAAGTAASIGVSYLFHATGHHRLERWTSAIHIGVAVGGAARNYALKTPHPN
jgi:hypothetical protein